MSKGVQLTVVWLVILTVFLGMPLFLSALFPGTWLAALLDRMLWVLGFAAGITGLRHTRKCRLDGESERVPARVQVSADSPERYVLRRVSSRSSGTGAASLRQTARLILEPIGACFGNLPGGEISERPVASQTVRFVLQE